MLPEKIRNLRVLIHWRNLPEYAAACIAEFRRRYPVQTLVLYDRLTDNAPYDRSRYADVGECSDITCLSRKQLAQCVENFRPEVALVGGWVRCARTIAHCSRREGALVVAGCDNKRRVSLWQRLFPLFYQVCLKRLIHFYLIHFYLVPGERSRTFLARNGVPLERIWTGFYSIDTNRFANVARDRQSVAAWPKAFLFVGQYIGRKGLPELLEAFGKANTEWSLILCGSGPRKDLVREHCSGDGSVVDKGFVQPGDLPAIMCSAGAFVLPSREDNWGLVALEAAAAGLPLACSTACGASAELVRVGKNGFLFHPGDTEGLVEALVQIASSSTSDLKAMSRASVTLAANYSASRWAENFWARISEQLSTA